MEENSSAFLSSKFSQKERWIVIACILLLIPALLINLGMLALLDDESIRALVSLEMLMSGEYIAPTINGAPYLRKPPLFNWIMLLFYELFGEVSEFTSRLPTVVFTCIYGYLVYHIYRQKMGNKAGIVIAFLTITCGRMFFFDTFLGLIDICFSMCMFSLMLGSYLLAEKEEWNKLFIFSYSIATIGYMLKALPAVAFLGITLLVILIGKKQFKKFFTPAHFIGMGIFLFIVVGYYYVYSLDNEIQQLFEETADQSTRRTFVKKGLKDTFGHLLSFPFEVIYHFLPWTILLIYLFKKGAAKLIWSNIFLRYNVLILGANLIIYWISPEVYGRYLLMFQPLIFAPLYYLHSHHKAEDTVYYKIVRGLMYMIVVIVVTAILGSFFVERAQAVPNAFVYSCVLSAMCFAAALALWKSADFNLIYIVLFVIIFRIGFNLFVFPDRAIQDYGSELRTSAIEIAKKYKKENIYTERRARINTTTSFYVTNEHGNIVKAIMEPADGVYIARYDRDCDIVDYVKNRTRGKKGYRIYRCQN